MTTHDDQRSQSAPGGAYPMDASCLFCKIIAGELPCARVYEDNAILAFLDINPISRGHTLVVPKGHYPTLLDFPDSEGEALVRAMRLVAAALHETLQSDGFNCLQNNFGPAGQMIFHAHWHLIPRYEGDGLTHWPGGKYKDNDDMRQLALDINQRIR
ncbi:HIT family protein [Desulfovibrio sp. OttesenSCG-928-M14]|nr:HIT family protein [Desulfovibrio sp. OttesenSCG-928-M14]MDL2291103.1 HIT family protein [Desulfovibrio sp. OttesenSCG-928-F20]